MNYRLLGRSGLRVSEICLGTMVFGDEQGEGWGATRAEAKRIFEVFTARGGNFFDTANNYCAGMSERYLGELIRDERDRYVVATKYTAPTRYGDPNSGGNHRKALTQSLDGSLERLGTDYVDLYWVHAWEHMTPIDEVMRALDDAVRSGKVLYVGFSDTPAWVVSQGNTLADLRGWSPAVAIQIQYSLLERTPERELIPMADALDLGILAWGPLAKGLLSGKYSGDGDGDGNLSRDDHRFNEHNLAIVEEVRAIAEKLGVLPVQVALSWLRARSERVIPLVGARTADQITESLDSLDVQLDEDQLGRLDELSQIALGFPHDMLRMLAQRHRAAPGGQIHDHRR
jgi:aryl-alcohol dehydrogenase-like predicted oxidoreductase